MDILEKIEIEEYNRISKILNNVENLQIIRGDLETEEMKLKDRLTLGDSDNENVKLLYNKTLNVIHMLGCLDQCIIKLYKDLGIIE